MIKDDDIIGILEFFRASEKLKNTLRTARTSNGRHESTAEHTWRLCLMALILCRFYKDIDALKLIQIVIIHDLGEAITGDISAAEQTTGTGKSAKERKGFETLIEPLPEALKNDLLFLWDDYENVSSNEALLAKAFDKLETLLQHTQGKNPDDFDYQFNLEYGRKYTDQDELTARLRSFIDRDTLGRIHQ